MTLAVVAVAAIVIGTFVSVMGTLAAADAEADALERDAQIKARNAILAGQDRDLAIETSRIDAADKRRDNQRQLAAIRAANGASGFEFTGSPIDVLEDTSLELALDVSRIEFAGLGTTRQFDIRIKGIEEGAASDRAAAKNAITSGRISAVGTAIAGLGSAAATGSSLGLGGGGGE